MMLTVRYYIQRITPFFVFFMLLQTVLRSILIIIERHNIEFSLITFSKLFAVGFIQDIGVFAYFAGFILLFALFIPQRWQQTRLDRICSGFLFALLAFILLFTATSEWFFWDEFASRFNFIAVDYLIYTQEVIGNIRESYPVFPILAGIAIGSMSLAAWIYRRSHQYDINTNKADLKIRSQAFALSVILAIASFFIINNEWTQISSNRYENEFAKNGIYEFFSAFRHNELSYKDYYVMLNSSKALNKVRQQLTSSQSPLIDDAITREIKNNQQEKHYNIILITVESLSANYLTMFGNNEHLTPYLDALANQSLVFTNLHAIGTRTVYGLAGITLSVPPLPGNSIVRRPHNENLFSLGSVLNNKGYTSNFIYGGFGYFDNMNAFFAANGYNIIDRSRFAKNEITFANVWGVCDEDLFNRVLRESDKNYLTHKPFFQMVMTTSNHRPFTFPEGKIDRPSGGGRRAGVKYTDYAIGKFIEAAQKKPWFKNTIIVVVADHTAGSAGKSELDPNKYLIPMLVYAPHIIKSQQINKLMSQIDVAPTLLGLMNMQYKSRFYGVNIMQATPNRAFISNYQQLGYLNNNELVILKPIKQISFYRKKQNQFVPDKHVDEEFIQQAISFYQSADHWKEWNKAIKNF